MNVEDSYEEHNNTSKEVSKALISNNFDNSLDYAEIDIDAFVNNEILKEIPIVKTVVGAVKSGLKIKEIHFTKKILTFLNEFHSGDLSPEKHLAFQKKFESDKKYRAKVLEQIMIVNDNFTQVEKSKIILPPNSHQSYFSTYQNKVTTNNNNTYEYKVVLNKNYEFKDTINTEVLYKVSIYNYICNSLCVSISTLEIRSPSQFI